MIAIDPQNSQFNILFTCIGRKVELVESFRHELKQLIIEGEIIGTDASPLSAALNICDYRHLVPRVDDPSYCDTLLNLCRKYKVKLLVPLTDLDLLLLAQNQALFAEVGTFVLISSLEVVKICQNKHATNQFFQENSIPTVRTLSLDEIDAKTATYPLFAKPAEGSGSINSFKIQNAEELTFFSQYIPNVLIQEYAPGQEFTIDALANLQGQVINAVPRKRIEVRAGEISKGVTVKDQRIINAVVEVLEKLGAIGPITIQCFVTLDQIKFIEINPRVGGGIPLTIAAGANYPRQIIEMVNGQTVDPCLGAFQDNFYMFRYEQAIYLSQERVFDVT